MARSRRLAAPLCLWVAAVGLCALGGPFAGTGAVVAKPKNGSSPSPAAHDHQGGGPRRPLPDSLDTSQTRVNQVQDDDGPPPHSRPDSSANRLSGKDYDGGAGGYQVQNTYGPPRDYYYDERPDYYRPHQVDGGGHHHFQSGPPEVIYHQHPPSPHQQYQYETGGHGGHDHPGELNIQPLLWPLAGITLLGVLSALVKAPLLLHLGTVGHRRRRRRRSSAQEHRDTAVVAETIKSLLDKFNDKEIRINAKTCLVCDMVASIYNQKSACVERSVCEVMSQNEPDGVKMDKRLLTAMIAQVIDNDQIPKEFKKRLESAETSGRSGGNCERLYSCRSDSRNEDSAVAPDMVLK